MHNGYSSGYISVTEYNIKLPKMLFVCSFVHLFFFFCFVFVSQSWQNWYSRQISSQPGLELTFAHLLSLTAVPLGRQLCSPIAFPQSMQFFRQVFSSTIQMLNMPFALLVRINQIDSLGQTFHFYCPFLISFKLVKGRHGVIKKRFVL